jgi:urease accessory protein
LLTPRASGPCVWSFAGTFGGGLLAGDDVCLDVAVGSGATLLLGTQASTKIYRSPNRFPARQSLRATVAPGGTLLALPDPVCPFADAVYEQRQTFALADASASLLLLDWLTSGRAARGERWAFSKYASRNAILVADQPLITDALTLEANDDLPINALHRAGARDCLATLIAVGPAAGGVAEQVLTRVAAEPLAVTAPVLAAASPLGDGGCVLRLMGGSVEAVAAYVKPLLLSVTTIAGDDPWSRKF